MIELRPIGQKEAFDFIRAEHRHHDVPVGGLWWQAVHNEGGRLAGVPITYRQCGAMNKRRRVTGQLGSPYDAVAWLHEFVEQRSAEKRARITTEDGK